MFQTLRANHLTCNPTKCTSANFEVDYLGFKIGSKGIRISDRKIRAVKNITAPSNVKSLQRLLGLFNFGVVLCQISPRIPII